MSEIGMELKIARIRARVSQRDVAEYMKVSQPRVSDIENQRKARPATIERYMKAVQEIRDRDEALSNEASR